MITTRKPIDGFAAGTMLLLCAIWGAQQVAIKLAAPDVAPIMQVALRSGLSALLVAALMFLRGGRLADGRTARPGLLAGALFAAEFLFIAEGLRRTSASHMAVFLYTAPVFTALGLHLLLPTERLRRHQWLGILVAFAGIALAFMGGTAPGGLRMATLGGDLLGILAGASWGATTVVIRTSALSEAPPSQTLLYQLAGGFVLLLAAAFASGQAGRISLTPVAWGSLLFQGVVVSFASYLTWFWLLRRYLATRLSVFSFMTPIFGVTFGVLVLGDPISPSFGGGAALVLAGITIVSGAGLLRPRSG
ncbi:MAG TPA: DMT family transporter [Anaeromyxobacteraceae bacterium]|nr:DMT family transporter [Anaeromyxobacteraceae bacterium]